MSDSTAARKISVNLRDAAIVGRYSPFNSSHSALLAIFPYPVSESHINMFVAEKIDFIKDQCLADHAEISVDKDIKGGLPHIKGTRITVQSVLDRFSIYGDVNRVQESLPHISETQIKDALAYARDFMEKACAQSEVDG